MSSALAAPAGCCRAAADTDAGSMDISSDVPSSGSSPAPGHELVDERDSDWFRQAEKDCDAFLARLARMEAELAEDEEEEEEEGEKEAAVAADELPRPDERVPSAVLARQQYDGEPWLKVEWRWCAEPTWVREDDFLDDGHLPLLDAFKLSRIPKPVPPSHRRAPKKKPRPPRELGYLDPEQYWPDFRQRLASMFTSNGIVPTTVRNIVNVQRSGEFLRTLLEARATTPDLVPAMLTHGTAPENVESIIDKGLCVPGTNGVKVRNGSVHGVGIYTSRCPLDSDMYVGRVRQMFVCAGLVDGAFKSTARQPGNYVVFTNPAHVLPLFLVSYQRDFWDYPGTCVEKVSHYHYKPRGRAPYLVRIGDRERVLPPRAPAVPRPPPATVVPDRVAQGEAALPAVQGGRARGEKHRSRLSKRDIRSMGAWAKRLYRQGVLQQKPSKR